MDNEVLTTNSTSEVEQDPAGTYAMDAEDAILPDDYEEGKPYALEENGVESGEEDLTDTDPDPTELREETPATPPASEEDTPALPQETQQDPGEQPPAADQESPAAPETKPAEPVGNSYKFTDTFQGMSREVEVKQEDIPDMYRKAMTADYVTRKIMTAEKNARSLGYEGLDDMLTKVRTSLMEAELNALLDDNVNETIAREHVNRKYAPLELMTLPQQSSSAPVQPQQPARNLAGELSELYAAYPAMRTQELPEPVATAARAGKNVLSAYNEYLAQHNAAEVQRLTKENEILRQNAASAAKAPVKGVTGSGATETKPKDPWDVGFESAY